MQSGHQQRVMASCSEYQINVLSFHARIAGPKYTTDLAQRLFPPSPDWSWATSATAALALRVEPIGEGDHGWQVLADDAVLGGVNSLAELPTMLAWIINSHAVEWLGNEHLLFHAGAVAVGQAGIILPGCSGSGKSTLTAALIAQGCSYFSDEVAVVAPECGSMLPFAKAIKLEPTSLPILASRFPELTIADDNTPRTTYLRPPDSVWPTAPVQPKYVVFPRYQAGARTRMEAIARAEGFQRLLAHSFSARNRAAAGVREIVRLLEGCACYDLTIGDLDDAVSEVLRLAAGPQKSGSTSSSQAPHHRFTHSAYRQYH